MKIASVILAGGAGTRLWPLSREDKPKQFHDLTGEGTLLESTIKRLEPLNPDICVIATSGRYEQMSKDELKNAGADGTVLIEPRPRNTAAAILYSAVYLSRLYDDSIMIVLPADHYIKRKAEFADILKLAVAEAMDNSLVTLGIKPTYPETGYGYIRAVKGKGKILKVDRFIEKPDRETAEKYLAEGNYFWNGGIFIWKTSVIMKYFSSLMPELFAAFSPLMALSADDIISGSNNAASLRTKIFSSIESVSIDKGIMEKAGSTKVIPSDIGWTDLGSWNSIDEIIDPDTDNNRAPDRQNSVFISSENCSVFSESGRIALVGVKNLVVVKSNGSILIMDKDSSQKVREVVEIVNRMDLDK